ncbi:MAG TPA: hypothetical protein VFE32_13660 [Puia sp.]|jgi:hypothetical protein|nr:hypothetical protein [Puia sp.]
MQSFPPADNAYLLTVDSQDQALCHLFFHCCMEDEQFTASELDDLSAKLTLLGLPPRIDIRKELIAYLAYKPSIRDEQVYIRYLLRLIQPVNELALYSYCTELLLDDPTLDPREDALLTKIAAELDLPAGEATLINRLIAQRKAVEIKKIF